MQITDVRVRKVAKEGKLKAVVSITIDDEFVVHDIKVIEGEKGLKERKDCLSRCQAVKRLMESIEILHTRSIREQGKKSSQRFSENMKKLWKRNLKRKCKRHNA